MFDRLIESVSSFAKAAIDFMSSFLNAAAEFLSSVSKKYRRITHLAFHAKKARVRKKNARRLFDILFCEAVLWQK